MHEGPLGADVNAPVASRILRAMYLKYIGAGKNHVSEVVLRATTLDFMNEAISAYSEES